MADIQVFFAKEQVGAAERALRPLVVYMGAGGGYTFDSAEYTHDHRLVRLARNGKIFHIPAQHVLLIVEDAAEEVG